MSGWSKEFDKGQTNHIYMMLQKDEPVLLSILNKALASLTVEERQHLDQKWFKNNDLKLNGKALDSELMKAVLDRQTHTVIEYFKMINNSIILR